MHFSAMAEPRGSNGSLVLALPISLTGRYAHLGRLAAAGLHQAVEDVAHRGGVRVGGRILMPEVVVFDDGGTRAGVRHALDVLARADLVIGPYGSDLVAEAARWSAERGRVLWNHGGSADEVQRLSGVVSVPAPASCYLAAVLEAVADRVPGAQVLVAGGRGAFGRSAGRGASEAAARLGMGVVTVVPHDEVPDEPDAEVLLTAGSFAEDVALIRRLRRRPPVVAAVAAGLGAFAAHVRAEGVLAPSQWEEGARFHPDTGPRPADVIRSLRARVTPFLEARQGLAGVDYPAAQAYAAGLIALRCVQETGVVEDAALDAAARRLHCTTFFGRFRLGSDGCQADHAVLVVQWRRQRKRLVWPPSLAEFPVEI
jgi:branched-chain amino acid transport system substrate-binding protein